VKVNALILFLLFFVTHIQAQEQDTLSLATQDGSLLTSELIKEAYDPLAPSRAAFYSAVIPGLGQAYNEKYWKIPIVYAGIGTSIYVYSTNRKDYTRFRDAYKRRLAGFEDDEFQGITNETLIRAQRTSRRNMDVSIAVAVGFYLLNIVDANVDAHLKQYNISDDLSLSPNLDFNPHQESTNYGFSLTYKMK
tara:strand:- start:20830 stop:21405 length:576 start_codon:yes stop_codon:yes gene_type:complete